MPFTTLMVVPACGQRIEKAAKLVEDRFRAAGLTDAGVGYRQPFTAVTGPRRDGTITVRAPGAVRSTSAANSAF